MKNKYLLLILILIIPFFIGAKDKCTDDAISIVSIEKDETQVIEIDEPTITELNISSNVKFFEVGNEIKYKIVVKNNLEEDLKIDKDSFKSSSNYIKYEIDVDSDSIKKNEEKNIYLTMKYDNEVDSSILLEGTYKEENNLNFNIVKEDKEEANHFYRYVILPILFAIFVVLLIIYIVLKKRQAKKLISIIILLFAIIPLTTLAKCEYKITINSKIEINGEDTMFNYGSYINLLMKRLSGQTITSTDDIATENNTVKAIKYSSIEPEESIKTKTNLASTSESSSPIYMWFEKETGTIYWWSKNNHPKFNQNSSKMFYNFTALTDISGLENIDTSEVEDMSFMFYLNKSNTSIKALSNWDISNVKTLLATFSGNSSLINLNGLDSWDVSNVTDMESLFYRGYKLEDISAIKNWDVSNVENLQQTFSNCINLEEIDLSNWNLSKVKNMNSTFGMWNEDKHPRYDAKLKRIKLSDKTDTSNLEEMLETFSNLTMIEDYSFLKYINTSKVKNMKQLFQCNYNFKDLTVLSNWDVSSVENFKDTFSFMYALESLHGLENWDTRSATSMDRMFTNCTKLSDISAIKNWNVSNVTNLEYFLSHNSVINDTSAIKDWDVKNVTNFNYMFYGSFSANPPIFSKRSGHWNQEGSYIPN